MFESYELEREGSAAVLDVRYHEFDNSFRSNVDPVVNEECFTEGAHGVLLKLVPWPGNHLRCLAIVAGNDEVNMVLIVSYHLTTEFVESWYEQQLPFVVRPLHYFFYERYFVL